MADKSMTSILRHRYAIEQVIPCGRAALGMYAAMRAWSAGRQDLVAIPAAVCQDVVAAILMAGCRPIFCDIDPTTGLVPMHAWQQARDAGATVAIVVHLYGNPADVSVVRRIFPLGECLVIDDAAQALGARCGTVLAGAGGDVGVLSFGYSKQLSVGGGVLLVRDAAFSAACRELLADASLMADREVAEAKFRVRFAAARQGWIATGDRSRFAGLLDGYDVLLRTAWDQRWESQLALRLEEYPQKIEARRRKALAWRQVIAATGLVPVGMDVSADDGCVPWRFACRLPGCRADRQFAIGDSLRAQGLQVSHWYLPANWLLGVAMADVPGAEQLAQEAFQFWLDETTTLEDIQRAEPILRSCFSVADG